MTWMVDINDLDGWLINDLDGWLINDLDGWLINDLDGWLINDLDGWIMVLVDWLMVWLINDLLVLLADINVEHAQLLIFLFHSLPLMQKKLLLLQLAQCVVSVAENFQAG